MCPPPLPDRCSRPGTQLSDSRGLAILKAPASEVMFHDASVRYAVPRAAPKSSRRIQVGDRQASAGLHARLRDVLPVQGLCSGYWRVVEAEKVRLRESRVSYSTTPRPSRRTDTWEDVMKVLHVLGELRASGAEVGLEKASGYWQHRGVRADILAIGETRGAFAGRLEAAGYAVEFLRYRPDPRVLAAYMRLIRRGRYDIVHIHSERAFIYLCLGARFAGARVVRTVRAYYEFEGSLARRRALQRKLARLAGAQFIAISPSVAANERDRFGNPTVLIDNWVDTDYFRPPSVEQRQAARLGLDVTADQIAIVTVGNCAPGKNHPALLKALETTQDLPWVWLHVGEESPNAEERSLAAILGVYDRCRFLGRRDPLEPLHASDVYAMPSLQEGLGMATIEALSTGLPALLTDVPGNRDLSTLEARTYFCSSDPAGLADGLRAAAQAAALGFADRRHIQHETMEKKYGVERGVESYTRLYASLLESTHDGS
jgi:glycosyltransferase involved in cell wall biosynthesis